MVEAFATRNSVRYTVKATAGASVCAESLDPYTTLQMILAGSARPVPCTKQPYWSIPSSQAYPIAIVSIHTTS